MAEDERSSTHELVAQLKARSRRAFEVFYARYAQRFYWYARKRGLSHEDAEEVADDTCLQILASARTYDPQLGHADVWMMTICHRKVIDRMRRVRRRSRQDMTLPVDTDPLAPSAPGPEVLVEDSSMQRSLSQSFGSLADADQAEIRRGPGRGPGRRRWHQAMARWAEAFRACYERAAVTRGPTDGRNTE